MPIQVRG